MARQLPETVLLNRRAEEAAVQVIKRVAEAVKVQATCQAQAPPREE